MNFYMLPCRLTLVAYALPIACRCSMGLLLGYAGILLLFYLRKQNTKFQTAGGPVESWHPNHSLMRRTLFLWATEPCNRTAVLIEPKNSSRYIFHSFMHLRLLDIINFNLFATSLLCRSPKHNNFFWLVKPLLQNLRIIHVYSRSWYDTAWLSLTIKWEEELPRLDLNQRWLC